MENQDEDMEIFKLYITSKNEIHFNYLFDKYIFKLRRFFYNRNFRDEMIEDLCQDTWLMMLRYSKRISTNGFKFYSCFWLQAKTAIHAHFRKVRIETVFIDGMEFECSNPTPFENVSEEGNLFLLRKHLQAILGSDVDAYFLGEHCPQLKIAEITETCAKTVRKQPKRLVNKLKQLMIREIQVNL